MLSHVQQTRWSIIIKPKLINNVCQDWKSKTWCLLPPTYLWVRDCLTKVYMDSNQQYISLNWPGCSPDWWSAWAGWCDRAARAPPSSGGWTPSCQTYIKIFFNIDFLSQTSKAKCKIKPFDKPWVIQATHLTIWAASNWAVQWWPIRPNKWQRTC